MSTTAPTRPARLPDSSNGAASGRRRLVALGLLASAQFVVMLDTSIVNVALPSIQADLRLSSTGLTWVVNAYVLTFGGLLLLFGRVADLLGRRRMFVGGAAAFSVGTLLAAFASTQELLVAGRVVQGAGAAALSPAAMALLLLASPGPARARAMSLWGAASALGGATGVLSGGLLAGYLGWSSVFFVTVPVSIAAVLLARRVLDEDVRGPRRRLDGRGALTITGAVLALVHTALAAGEGHPTSTTVLVGLGLSATLLALFVAAERGAADPLVPLALFRSRALSTGVGLAVLGGATRASSFVLVALYLQQGLAMEPQQAGLAMVPTSLTGFAFSLALLPRMLRKLGPERSLVAGLVILAGGQLWLAHVPGDGYAAGVLPALFLIAVGVALSFTPTTMVIASAAPAAHTGLASGLAGSATQVGSALGTATFTAIGVAVAGAGADALDTSGFSAAFTAAAVVALATATLGSTLVRRR
ncbi:MFS transporter [Nocardioides sp. MH1]|uniref:MFS transporter n=1 Tax=Nocardioides sp. MH1 TaxID=3242490 RepID=UPI0035217329